MQAVTCILAFAASRGLALLGVAQIVLLHQWCEYEAARQFAGADTWTAALQLDSTPAVTCSNGPRALETPVAPAWERRCWR
ncbi:MAG TPA: hypothetical protein VIL00_15515 [Pseudonocardiaceae bacterium]